jgi:hypothetical protein
MPAAVVDRVLRRREVGVGEGTDGLSGALTVAGGALLSAIGGTVLTEVNAAPAMLAMLLLASLLGLAAALFVLRIDRREAEARALQARV